MAIPVITFEGGRLRVLDQTRLPRETVQVELTDLEAVVHAIKTLTVRGAPLIGVTAGYGLCISLKSCAGLEEARKRAPEALARLRDSRPTAINLFWALERMERRLAELAEEGWREALEAEARAIYRETESQDAALMENGAKLLQAGASVVTHCNTGPLATGAYGTALGVLIGAHRTLGDLHVFVDETRPRWQGANLTTWELANHGVPYTLIVDSAAAVLMQQGKIHSAWVGADRIAANGDTANKIGTYALALAARHHAVPFYVVAPTSTIDLSLDTGEEIPIEERDPGEVAAPRGLALAPEGTRVWNPAFDVTPADLIGAIVTERGVFQGPQFDLRRALR